MSAGRMAIVDRGGPPAGGAGTPPLGTGVTGATGVSGDKGSVPPPAAGTTPLASGDRLVIAVMFAVIGTARNIGAAGVRQPQYFSSFPRKRSSNFCSACSKTPAG